MKSTLQNKHCITEYREDDKQIFTRDLRDMNNEPATYTKSKRGLKNAWAAIVAAWTEDTTMSDIGIIFTSHGIKYHYWCMVD